MTSPVEPLGRQFTLAVNLQSKDIRTVKPTTPASTLPRRRKSTRHAGLRQVRIWIPDMDEATFRAEAHRQFLLAASSPGAKEDQDFIDAISDPLPTE